MTDDINKPSQELTTQQRAAVGKTEAGGVSGRLKAALDDMTWNGTPWEESARKANLTVRAMRLAMKRPQVLKYLRAERRVLLASMSQENLHRLREISRQDENKAAAVQAARALEALADTAIGSSGNPGQLTPGLVIQIVSREPLPPQGPIIEVAPNPGLYIRGSMDNND